MTIYCVGNTLMDVVEDVDALPEDLRSGDSNVGSDRPPALTSFSENAAIEPGGAAANIAAALGGITLHDKTRRDIVFIGQAGAIQTQDPASAEARFAKGFNDVGVQFALGYSYRNRGHHLSDEEADFLPEAQSQHPTGVAHTLIHPGEGGKSERTFRVWPGALQDLRASHVQDVLTRLAPMEDGDHLYISAYLWNQPETCEAAWEAARIAQARGAKITFGVAAQFIAEGHDENLWQFIKEFRPNVIGNETEIPVLFGDDVQQKIEEYDLPLVVMTQGGDGSVWYAPGREPHHEAVSPIPGAFRNTNGAGDSFTAAMMHGIEQGWDIEEMAPFCSKTAAYMLTQEGARSRDPHAFYRHVQADQNLLDGDHPQQAEHR